VVDADEVARHRLPEDENRAIFRDEIVPDLLAGRATQEIPTVVFLIGQPGAGKSRVTDMVADVLNKRGGFVDVDSDLYKPYHPEYDALMAQDDTLMAAYTRADGRAWMAQAEQYVRDNGLNAVIQETSQDGAAVAEKMAAYREAGARVEALAMGVPEAMSNQGIVHRYHEQVRERGQGRLTVQANADQSYSGILDLAVRVDDGRLADQTAVFRRGEAEPRYSNALSSAGEWQAPPAFRAAIEAERVRPWTQKETADFVAAQTKLRAGMGREWAGRLDRIENLAKPLMTPDGVKALADARRSAAATATSTTVKAKPAPAQKPPSASPDAAPRRDGPGQSPGPRRIR